MVFNFYPRLLVELATAQVPSILGSVLIFPSCFPKVVSPSSKPWFRAKTNEVRLNQYSGNYGLAEFPLHSDLAHWAVPPRYFMLRCVAGAVEGPMADSMRTTRPAQELHTVTISRFHQFHLAL
jgi:Taurine catabolism dioxygenase TauD, TfdA family.